MKFAKSNLPDNRHVRKAFRMVNAGIEARFGARADDIMEKQIVILAVTLASGFEPDQVPVPLVCAALLSYLNPRPENNLWIKTAFNKAVFNARENLDSMPNACGESAEDAATRLTESDVNSDCRLLKLAHSVSALTQFNARLITDPQYAENDVFLGQAHFFATTGAVCRHENSKLAKRFDAELALIKTKLFSP